jgi:hypothetical protein
MMRWGSGKGNFRSLGDYARLVEGALHDFKVDVESARVRVESGYAWRFKRGSAVVEVNVVEQDGRGYLQVMSPIMYLPSTGLLPLYRRLLEYNMQLTNAALGVFQEVVYVFHERSLEDLDAGEAQAIIVLVSNYADDLDNGLVNEYGGRLYSQI